MEIIYKNDKVKGVCNNLKYATKKYGLSVAKALHKVIDLLSNIMKSLDNEQLMFIKCIKIQIEEVSEHYE